MPDVIWYRTPVGSGTLRVAHRRRHWLSDPVMPCTVQGQGGPEPHQTRGGLAQDASRLRHHGSSCGQVLKLANALGLPATPTAQKCSFMLERSLEGCTGLERSMPEV